MRARRIIEGAAFGPDAIRTAAQAFEAAWSEIAGRFDAAEHEAARQSLATAIITSAREDSKTPTYSKGPVSGRWRGHIPISSLHRCHQVTRPKTKGTNREPPA